MSTFHVFVEGATQPGEAALAKLADAMAGRYGLPAADLLARMQRGRFRVKANVDRVTAETYVKDLTSIGARAVVEEGRVQSQPSMPVPTIPSRPSTPPGGMPAIARTTSNPQFQSGLAAAFESSQAKTDLGALESASFSLASVDGEDVAAPPAAVAFEPPPAAAAAKATTAPAKKVASAPSDNMFAPPDEGDDAPMELAADERDLRKSSPSIPPLTLGPLVPSASPPIGGTPAMRRSSPSLPPANEPSGGTAARRSGLAALIPNARARLAAGVFLAILVGFVPATIVTSLRESSAFAAIDARVVQTQRSAVTLEQIDALDSYRATELDAKKSARRNIAIVSMLIWAVVGAGVGAAFFKLVPDPDA